LTLGAHRRAVGFEDGGGPQNDCRTEKLSNLTPYYCGAKFFEGLKAGRVDRARRPPPSYYSLDYARRLA
jgi:hypothetical protein